MNNINNRDHVIEVAAKLFFNNGFGRTSMDEVMRESGVSKSNIYYHFSSKEDLAGAVAEWWVKKYETMILSVMENREIGLKQRFATVLEALMKERLAADLQGGCPFISLYVQCAGKEVRGRIRLFFAELAMLLEKWIAQGQATREIRPEANASETAVMFVSAMEGALLLAEICGDPSIVGKTGNALIQLL